MRALGRNLQIVLLAALVAVSAQAEESSERLQLPDQGFSIEPIEGPARVVSTNPLVVALPPADGFAPNLNVQLQPFGGPMVQYVAATHSQLLAAGLEWQEEPVLDGSEATFEYAGVLEGRELRWYARAIQRDNLVYLVTATVPRGEWEALGARMRRAVDSFRLEPAD